MCSPEYGGYASIGMQAFGAVSGAFGAGQQASAAKAQLKAQANAAEFQAKVNKNNAQIAQWQAEDALRQGQEAEFIRRMQGADLIGKQKVAYAASGVALDSESAINTLASTKYITEYDATTIKNNAARAAWGYEIQRNSYLDSAAAAHYTAQGYSSQASAISPSQSVFGSLLSSATQMAPSIYGMYQSGMFEKKYSSIDDLAKSKGFW